MSDVVFEYRIREEFYGNRSTFYVDKKLKNKFFSRWRPVKEYSMAFGSFNKPFYSKQEAVNYVSRERKMYRNRQEQEKQRKTIIHEV